jgi:oligoendopeptidase F
MTDRVARLYTQIGMAAAFIEPEILTIDPDMLRRWMTEDPSLALYQHALEKMLREREHVRTEEIEELLAGASEIGRGPTRLYGMLTNTDMVLPEIALPDGGNVRLTQGNYTVFLQHPEREIRKQGFEAIHASYRERQNTITAIFSSYIKQRIFFARQRHYPTTLEASLSGNAIPSAVYDTLVETVSRGLPALHRYLQLRQRVLGVDQLHMYDIQAPLVKDVEFVIPFAEARDIVLGALAPLGKDYLKGIHRAFNERWIDVHENVGKRSGAYNFGVYGVHPFVLLNYQDRLQDVFTLAHELGHSMHSYYSTTTQPYTYYQYTIFIAEIASTFNEALLTDYLVDRTTERERRAFLLTQYISRLYSTLFRQTMFADFERQAHARAEAGEALTPDLLCSIYLDLNQRYFGDAGVVVDDLIAWEWSRIPHFYMNFYVYQYATGVAASLALAHAVRTEGQPAIDRYIELLRSGSKDYSINLLIRAGVDMTIPAPIEAALAEFERLVGELDAIV